MRDLFSGSLGRLNNHGGSRIFTTPNTIYVPPDYEVETDVPSVAEFVTCSLDGRLWIFRRSRRYYLAVFKWDNEAQQLVFAKSDILSNETVINRGVDWILTDKSFIQSSSNEPYFSRTEYLDGDIRYINTIKQSYSFFPEFETWTQIQNGQSLNISNSPFNQWRVIQKSNITPLEVRQYSDGEIRSVTEISPQVCYCNGQLFAKGTAHIGRAYLVPRAFNSDREPMNFYLYISPDYIRNYDAETKKFDSNDGWNNLILVPLNQNSFCMFSLDNQDFNTCKRLENVQIISSEQVEQLDFTANHGAIFFDGFTHSNLVLNDNGASFLYDNLSYESKALRQWLAPCNNFDVISTLFAISSCDNLTLATHIQQGFYREALLQKKLSLSVQLYSGKRLAIGETDKGNVKVLHINTINDTINYAESADWDKVYRFPFRLSLINSFQHYLAADRISEEHTSQTVAVIQKEIWGDYTFDRLISVGIDGSNPVYEEMTVPGVLLDIENYVKTWEDNNPISLSEHESIQQSVTFITSSHTTILVFHPQDGTCSEEHLYYSQSPQYTIASETERVDSYVGPYAFLGANLWHVIYYERLRIDTYSKYNGVSGSPDGQYSSEYESRNEYGEYELRNELAVNASDEEWKPFSYNYYIDTVLPHKVPFRIALTSVTQNIAIFKAERDATFYVDIQSMCPDCPYIERADECRNYYSINNAFEFRHTVRVGNTVYTFKSEIFPDLLQTQRS